MATSSSTPATTSAGGDHIEEFFDMVADVWNHGFMGVDIGRILVALIVIALALLFRNFFSKFVVSRLQSYTEKNKTAMDDRIVLCLIPPIKFIPVVIGLFLAGRFMQLDGDFGAFYHSMIRSLIAFTIFWAIYRAVHPISLSMKRLEKILSPTMMRWMFKALRALVIFIGAAVILEMWGIQVGPLLAGLGLFGAAVALGAQDLFRNLIGGFTLIAEKRFNPGEVISVEGVVTGTVEDIGFRSTRLRRADKTPVYVPNSKLSDAAVTNLSRMPHRLIKMVLHFGYETSTQQLRMIRDEILGYISENKEFADEKGAMPTIRIDNMTANSIELLVQCFTNTTNWDEWMKIKEELFLNIKEIVEDKAKAAFVYPTMNVSVDKWLGDSEETSVKVEDATKALRRQQ